MKTIHVTQAFNLLLSGGRSVAVAAGVNTVDNEVADHWFTKGFLAHGGLGSSEYAEAAWGALNTAFTKAVDAQKEYELLLKASNEADEAAGIDQRDPPHVGYIDRLREEARAAADEDEDDVEDDVEDDADEPAPVIDVADEAVEGAAEGTAATEAAETGADEAANEAGTIAAEDAAETVVDALDHDHDGKKGVVADVTIDTSANLDGALVEAMTDDELRTFITQKDGRAPHPNTGHEKLLEKAKALAAAPTPVAETGADEA